jgi:hypothetical protein
MHISALPCRTLACDSEADLGCETDAIFRRYNITDEEDKREALRKLATYRASKPAASNVVEMPKQEVSR